MGHIKGIYLMPHPPILLPEIGGSRNDVLKDTILALEEISKDIRQKAPDVVILITPHGPVFEDGFALFTEKTLHGDFSRFGNPDISMDFSTQPAINEMILEKATRMGLLSVGINNKNADDYGVDPGLDWGALVPLYFIRKGYEHFRLVCMGISMLPNEELYRIGKVLRQVIEASQENAVVIASGDLSHRLSEDGPYGYHAMGAQLDKAILDALEKGNIDALMQLPKEMLKEGSACALQSILMSLGTMDGCELKTQILSYQGPYGVGYAVARIDGINYDSKKEIEQSMFDKRRSLQDESRTKVSIYVALARNALETYVLKSEGVSMSKALPQALIERSGGVFVSIKKHGNLRGCIGTVGPTKDNLASEIIHNAVEAGIRDPRFLPVTAEELPDLSYSVDILEAPEQITSLEALNVKEYGVIVEHQGCRGLLLPDLEGVDTPEEQVRIALSKAGIPDNAPYCLSRFKVTRYR